MSFEIDEKKFDFKIVYIILAILIIFILCVFFFSGNSKAEVFCKIEKTMLDTGKVNLNVTAYGNDVYIKTYDNKIIGGTSYEVIVDKNGKYEFYAISGSESSKCVVDITEITSLKKVSKIKLNSSNITLPKGSSFNLKIVAIEPVNSSCDEVSWMSSDSDVATVKDGTVYTHSSGNAFITASCDGVTATSKINVVSSVSDNIDISIDILNIDNSSFEIKVNALGNLSLDNPYSWDGVNWTSDSSNIVNTVGANKIYVKNAKQEIIEFNYNVKSLNYSVPLDSSVLISSLLDEQLFNYESSDLDVVSIDYDGKIYAKNVGNAVVSATSNSSEVYIWLFNVVEKEKVNSFVLSSEHISLPIGSSYDLKIIETKPENSSCSVISWKSSDDYVVTVSNGTITAKSAGNAVITVSCDDIIENAKVSVVDGGVSPIDITLNSSNLNLLEGGTFSLVVASINPSNAVCNNVFWESSDNTVVSVKDGFVTAKKAGSATITARCDNASTSIKVTVSSKKVDPIMIILNTSKVSLMVGNSYTLKIATVLPSNATCNSVSWKSSNNGVVTVNNGVVTAKGVGSAIITANCDGIVASSTVTVNTKATFTPSEMESVKSLIKNSGVPKVQVAVINKGSIVGNYSYNCSDSDSFYVSAISKSILGILAAKMEQDGLIDLDVGISKYWYALKNANFDTYSSDWKSWMGSVSTIREYAGKSLVQNPTTLRNALMHSSTIKNGYMVHMNPQDDSSEYFEGSMSSTYAVALFMLSHTYGQLFESGKKPGAATSYNYLSDNLTREHALAGFTMQISMKKSLNEYLKSSLLSPIGGSTGKFKSGNSIYFATGYQTSAVDLAKIISVLANDGYYGSKQIFNSTTMKEIEKIEGNLANQSIAFSYVNGKFVRYGSFSKLVGASNYGLSDLSKYYSYVSYNPSTGDGVVVTTYGNSANAKKLVNSIDSYVYSNS